MLLALSSSSIGVRPEVSEPKQAEGQTVSTASVRCVFGVKADNKGG
jgi:hypothetical protein